MKYLLLLSIFLISSCTKEVIVSESEIKERRVNEAKEQMNRFLPPEFVLVENLGSKMYIVSFRGKNYIWRMYRPNSDWSTEIFVEYDGPVKSPVEIP